ncbi:MAG TPA: hypothetical protein VFV84_12735, partial [Burkholderiales bacterium]|nr:hypothetical protein [Burkholderiales bacterium]
MNREHGETVARDAAAHGQRLLDRIIALGIDYGREDSFKMSAGRLLADRFLIGLRARELSTRSILDVAAGIGMPEPLVSALLAQLPRADVVLFGMEDGDAGLIYKAYLEFWEEIRRTVRATGSTAPALMNLGFKWQADGVAKPVVSRYTCYPMLDLAGILARVRRIHAGHEDQPSGGAARSLIERAAARGAPFIYLEVGEEGTPRSSYDINLYRANLTLAEVEPIVRETARRYALPEDRFLAFYSGIRARPLGHLSGGVGR